MSRRNLHCSGPYAPGAYWAGCFADVYVGGEGEASYPSTPKWTF